MMTYEDTREVNARWHDAIASGNIKEATSLTEPLIRTTFRERCAFDEVITPKPFKMSDNVPRLDDDSPYFIGEIEPDSVGAITVAFGTYGHQFTMKARKFPVRFGRLVSGRAAGDVTRLGTYRHDIRSVITDIMVRELLAEKDSNITVAVMTMLYAQDTVSPFSGAVQWQKNVGPITRQSLLESLKIMPRLINRLQPEVCLTSMLTALSVEGFEREEAGGDWSQDLLLNGFHKEKFMNRRWIFTIKLELVPEGRVLHFANEECLGYNLVLMEPQMFIKSEYTNVEMQIYAEIGFAFAHSAGVSCQDHDP